MTLSKLPEGLDATYSGILTQIPKLYHQEAQVVFTLLISARRAISLAEAAEAAAIDIQTHSFDKSNRLRNPTSVLKICSSFLSLSPFKPKVTECDNLELATTEGQKEVRFAHYSVEEYLISERAPNGFRLTKDNANAIVARITLGYLLSISTPILPGPATLECFPLLLHAASYWFAHTKVTHACGYRDVHQLVLRFFRPEYGNALHAASSNGHRQVVEMLLAKGADVNAQGGHFGNALHAASSNGHHQVVEMLLAKGASESVRGSSVDSYDGSERDVLLQEW
jgi:Ankyrin repeats (3 copies)